MSISIINFLKQNKIGKALNPKSSTLTSLDNPMDNKAMKMKILFLLGRESKNNFRKNKFHFDVEKVFF